MNRYHRIQTPLGNMLLVSRNDALCGFYFEGQRHAPVVQSSWKHDPNSILFAEVERQLDEVIAGKRKEFDLPICSEGTEFQKAVWEVIRAIPFGKTITYSELAIAVGRPKAVRAVGAATGRNPISWIVPCHRVMGANGAITGYAGGVARKEALLRFEVDTRNSLRGVISGSVPLGGFANP